MASSTKFLRLLSFLAAFLSSLLTTSAQPALNPFDYCFYYYGSVSAELFIPETASPNGTDCPTNWRIPSIRGGSLKLCPPFRSQPREDGAVIDFTLWYGNIMGEMSFAVDGLEFSDALVTNGSFGGEVENGGEPAVLAPDPAQRISEDWRFEPRWTINGTQKALTRTPEQVPAKMVYLTCRTEELETRAYCGSGAENDCWAQQYFYFSLQDRLNFTVKFTNLQAEVYLWVESEYMDTGANTVARIEFGGARQIPSVTDYEFWSHAGSLNYEYIMATEKGKNIELRSDEEGYPVFWNGSTGRWYATRNATFSVENGAVGRLGQSWVAFALAVVTTLVVGLESL